MDGPDILIIGGGLAGALCAVALKRSNPHARLLLVEGDDHFGGNHRWSYFDSDLEPEAHALLDSLEKSRWSRHEVRFPKLGRLIETGYNSFSSSALDRWVRRELAESEYRLGTKVDRVGKDHIRLADGTRINAACVLDARGPQNETGLAVGWQKFAGFEFEVAGHGLQHPIIMDARIDQTDGYRFIYTLPLGPDRLFVEDTYYSDTTDLDVDRLRAAARRYAGGFGHVGAELGAETGVLPIVLSGDPDRFWPDSDGAARAGMMGGFFHHTTGYSLPLAVANAQAFARAWAEGARIDAGWWRDRFTHIWRQQRYFRLLNRMLFKAAPPELRYRVFEHFYRLPLPLIQRFYRGSLTWTDKCRILTGKPPVPIGKAVGALLRRKENA